VEGCCEHGDELSGSLKPWKVLEWLYNWQLLRKDSAPQVSKYIGRAIAHAVSRWLPTAAARVQTRV
jgi:hypothetical protein